MDSSSGFLQSKIISGWPVSVCSGGLQTIL
jgi:hypothetical protein